MLRHLYNQILHLNFKLNKDTLILFRFHGLVNQWDFILSPRYICKPNPFRENYSSTKFHNLEMGEPQSSKVKELFVWGRVEHHLSHMEFSA